MVQQRVKSRASRLSEYRPTLYAGFKHAVQADCLMVNIMADFFFPPSSPPFLLHSGVSGFISAGSVCDALPAEGDLHPAAVPSVFTGLCYGGCPWPGLHWKEDSEEAWGPAHPEGGQTPRQTHPEEHVSLPDWPLLWHAHHRYVSEKILEVNLLRVVRK